MTVKIHITLKRLMKERGVTVTQLAKRAGVPHSTLSTWLLPSARPQDPVQIAAVARELGVGMHTLLFDEPENGLTLESLVTQSVLDGLYRLRLERVVLPQSEKEKKMSQLYCRAFAVLGLFALVGCAGAPKKSDIVIRDFSGDYGSDVRQAVESRIGTVKQFRVIASDSSSVGVVQEEAVKGKNRDDLFSKQDSGVKLGEGLAGSKVLHGTCTHTKHRYNPRPNVFPWLIPLVLPYVIFQSGDQVTDHELYCKYRLINAENHVQEAAGDTKPRTWTSDNDTAVDNGVIRKIASDIVDDISDRLSN